MKNKKVFLSSLILILIIFFITCIYFYVQSKNRLNEYLKINAYYLSPQINQIIPEERNIKRSADELELVNYVFTELKAQPKSSNLLSAVPDSVKIISAEIENKILKLNLSDSYKSLKESNELFCRAALVWTMTELQFIENVEIFINGEPLKRTDGQSIGQLNRNNVVINPTISPDKINIENVVLYFSDEFGNSLVAEDRKIEVKQSESIENQIVEQLILGPNQRNLFSTVPAETKIRNIKTEDSICYVDLSSEFVSKHSGGSTSEILTIYSIVNSLTELPNVKKVQFLIEGEKVNTFKGDLDISKAFERDENIIS